MSRKVADQSSQLECAKSKKHRTCKSGLIRALGLPVKIELNANEIMVVEMMAVACSSETVLKSLIDTHVIADLLGNDIDQDVKERYRLNHH